MKTAKKTNNSGFTLVELIVVMALLAIIMGAILNFIQPTAKLYATTNAYLNQEEAVSSVYNVLNDDLMFPASTTAGSPSCIRMKDPTSL